MLAKKELIEEIRLGFSFVQSYVRPGGKLNLTDINVLAEDLAGDILNAACDWHLDVTSLFWTG